MVFETAFLEFSALLLLSVGVGAFGLLLRQPLIVSFLIAGIVAGPSGLGLVQSQDKIKVLAEFGVAILLFVVGLKLDLGLIRSVGKVAVITGLGQVIFTSVIGFFLCLALDLDPIPSVYIAVALTFSSTIIIVKLLSDKGEIDALHGRVALGFLIVQDLAVILVMMGLSSLGLGSEEETSLLVAIAIMLGKGVALLGGGALFIRYVIMPMLARIAASTELLFLSSVTLAVVGASVSGLMGFSGEMGAFLIGVALASTPYREAVASRLTSLRDFLLLFFFIELGSHMDLAAIGDLIVPGIWLSLFVLLGNPLIVMIIMGVMGYRRRTGFLAGLTVAQISEFSLIFAALGRDIGHITPEHVGLVTMVGLITIGASTYMILYSHHLFGLMDRWLGIFERRDPFRERSPNQQIETGEHFDIIVFGLGRFGDNIARGLRQQGWKVLGVDFDPEAVRNWHHQGHAAVYGDAADPEFLHSLPLKGSRWVLAAIPAPSVASARTSSSRILAKALRAMGYEGRVAVTAQHPSDFTIFHHAGADLVLLPFVDAARHAVEKLMESGEAAQEARRIPQAPSSEAAPSPKE